MGVGNFFGMLPDTMQDSRLYGVELDSITGRIAKKLYPQADITVAGFETTDRRDFYDLAVGNVPFGQYPENPASCDNGRGSRTPTPCQSRPTAAGRQRDTARATGDRRLLSHGSVRPASCVLTR